MSDELRQRGKRLINDVVKDIKGRKGQLGKLRQMTQLAKEIDPEFDVTDIEDLLDVSEAVSDNVLKRLDKTQKET